MHCFGSMCASNNQGKPIYMCQVTQILCNHGETELLVILSTYIQCCYPDHILNRLNFHNPVIITMNS